jgi:recombination protein RecT
MSPELRDEQDRQEAVRSNAATLETFLQSDSFTSHLSQILPGTFNTDRFATIALRQCRNIPELALCDLSTVAASIMEAAGLGLEIGINGECWIIPRKVSHKDSRGNWLEKTWEAGLQIGYQGHLALAWRSTMVAGIQADVVIDGDDIDFEKGTKGFLRHRAKKGRVISGLESIDYAYIVIDTIYGGTVWDIIDRVEIERIRNSGPSANSPAWKNWPDQMAQGKVTKRGLKFGPRSREVARAGTLDDAIDAGIHQTFHGDLPAIPATLTPAAKPGSVDEALQNQDQSREEEAQPSETEVPSMQGDQRESVEVAQSGDKKPSGPLGF